MKLVQKTRLEHCLDLEKTFDKIWRDRVLHYQVPLFTPTKTAIWSLSFDGVLADALESGPLRNSEITLTEAQEKWIRDNRLLSLEGNLQNKAGSSKIRLEVGVIPAEEKEAQPYTDHEKATALMGQNGAIQNLV